MRGSYGPGQISDKAVADKSLTIQAAIAITVSSSEGIVLESSNGLSLLPYRNSMFVLMRIETKGMAIAMNVGVCDTK